MSWDGPNMNEARRFFELCRNQPLESKKPHVVCSLDNQPFCRNLAQAFCSKCPKGPSVNPFGAMPKLPTLEGVADEWEDNRVVRKNVRSTKTLIQPLNGDETVSITGKTAGHNYEVLAPLVKRLRDENGEIHSRRPAMPEILDQKLVFDYLY